MPRPRKDGPKRVRKTLSDGTTWNFLYDRRTGAAMGKERVAEAASGFARGTLGALIEDYLISTDFTQRARSTQDLYRRALAYLKTTVGDLDIQEITPAAVQEIKEALASQPSRANLILALLSILFKRAIRKDMIKYNPAAAPGKLEIRKRTEVWSYDKEDAVLAEFPWPLDFAFMLMLYTCQRLSDVLEMNASQIMERTGRFYITLKQQKTGGLVAVPVHQRLAPFLERRLHGANEKATAGAERPRWPRSEIHSEDDQSSLGGVPPLSGRHRGAETHIAFHGRAQVASTLLITSPTGLRWARRNFSRSWDNALYRVDEHRAQQLVELGWSETAVRDELAAEHRQRRDLRRTGIVRLAEGGATTPQIAAISGHSIDYCQRIIDTYLPRRTEVALGGIELWEAAGTNATVIRLSDQALNRSDRLLESNRKPGLPKRFSRA